MMEMLAYEGWVPKLVSTQATDGKGVDALWNVIVEHDAWLRESGRLRAKRRDAFAHRVRQLALGTVEARLDAIVDALPDDVDPYEAASRVLERFNVRDGVQANAHARVHGAIRARVRGL